MTEELARKHLPMNEATICGHIKDEKHGLQSTAPKQTIPKQQNSPQPQPVEIDTPDKEWQLMEDMFPVKKEEEKETNQVAFALHHNTNNRHKGYMDLTGKFPFKSERNMQYLLVAYVYDANAILVEPLQNRQAKTISDAWERIQKQCIRAGIEPSTYVLDNETSETLEAAFTKYKVEWQYVPPKQHRANLAERAIQTFKDHFKTGLATVHPDFPMNQWDLLLHKQK